jgi:hypothetical protein
VNGFDTLLGMTNDELIAQLQAERHRIDAVIKLLSGPDSTSPTKAPKATRKRKGISAAGRKRISDAMKKRWADAKKKA